MRDFLLQNCIGVVKRASRLVFLGAPIASITSLLFILVGRIGLFICPDSFGEKN